MTATHRLKGLGWLAICVIAALGFYMVSLQVSVERKKLETVNHQIAQAHRDIRELQTEFATRSNLAQLEQWNGQVLALAAPTAGQYLPGEQALASLTAGPSMPGDAKIETAAMVIPSLPTVLPPPDAPGGADVPAAAPAPAKAAAAPVQVAALKPSADRVDQAVRAVVAHAAASAHAAAGHAKGEAMAMLDRKLLSDATLGDLQKNARAERVALR
ncbi:MAG: hypothetical protein ACTHMG_00675 [Sphingomonas sp.]